MHVTFDSAKDAVNLTKHRVSLLDAAGLEWDAALLWPDKRRDYGEPRMIGLVPLNDRLFCVVFVDRPAGKPTERRVISLRKANRRKVKRYADND